MKDPQVYLAHIAGCIRKIENNIAEGKDKFFGSETLQDAVLRNLQVLCESTQMLDAQWKAAHSQVDWRLIGDFRNRLVHDYMGIDLEIVWKVLNEDLPELKKVIATTLLQSKRESPPK